MRLSAGFTPCRHLRPSSGREHTFVELIQSGDDDFLMIFYVPSRTDTTGHIPRPLFAQSWTTVHGGGGGVKVLWHA